MRINVVLTVTAGTPQCLATALGCLAAAPTACTQPILANRIDVQMGVAAAVNAYGSYMDLANFPAGTVASKTTAGHVTAQLAPSTTTAPGALFTDAPAGIGFGGARDITKVWLDQSATGGTIIVSVDLRN